ncbi:oxidoreductase [Pseudomonas sp. S25]|uniref:Oxidoreductase n=1 Tax=Pseudomonas maioricensis TaxID=1766623 RepID=A0ABS9ZU03_9PSED|nr:Gfo/Idh/MocA family oxidoreductase [Pseudomonas sp. S25]MCI8212348.1 oxidoreductase [Pseudomonas sp. S25]
MPNAKPLRGALIGCGFFALNQLRAWQELEGVEIVALCDNDAERLAAFASHHPGAAQFTDAQVMLNELHLDFVDIVTPPVAHKPLVLMAALAGVQVICQKPFALTLDDARVMINTCAEQGVSLTVHENFRWQAAIRATIEQLRSGVIGTPFFGRISFRSGFDVYRLQPYLAQTPRFIVEDLGVHVLDISRALFGDVGRLTCETRRVNPAINGEDVATLLLAHDSGVTSVVDFSYATRVEKDPFPQSLLEIDGNKGSLRLLADFSLQVHAEGVTRVLDVTPSIPGWAEAPWFAIQESVLRLQREWLLSQQSGSPAETCGSDNFNTQALVEAAYESAEKGTTVRPQRWG